MQFADSPEMRVIFAGVLSTTNILIEGDPGEGKTAKMESTSRKWGYYTDTIVVSNREPQDFLGYPSANTAEQVMEYYPLRWSKELNEHKKSLAIFDEFSLGSDCFPATMQFFAERRIGDIQLHDGVSAIAIMNPVEVSANGAELTAPMSNRFIHVKWKFDQQEWLDNLVSGFDNIEPPDIMETMGMVADDKSILWGRSIVRAFLSQKRDVIRPGAPRDPLAASKPWPSPRTWTFLSDMLGHIHPQDYDAINLAARGAVGEGAASEFLSYMKSHNLFDPEMAMADPKSVDYTGPVDIIIALLSGVEAIGLDDPDRWEDAIGVMSACAESQRTDMALPFSRRLIAARPRGKKIPRSFADKFSDLLDSTGKVKKEVAA